MPKLIDLTGKQFGHLTVVKRAPTRVSSGGQPRTMWHCQCDCGRAADISSQDLRSGKVRSCGHDRLSGIKKYTEQHMKETPGTNVHQLSDRPASTNTSGYRNISTTYRNGVKYYRVNIQYKGKQYGHMVRTLDETLKVREELRSKYWPNYQKNE